MHWSVFDQVRTHMTQTGRARARRRPARVPLRLRSDGLDLPRHHRRYRFSEPLVRENLYMRKCTASSQAFYFTLSTGSSSSSSLWCSSSSPCAGNSSAPRGPCSTRLHCLPHHPHVNRPDLWYICTCLLCLAVRCGGSSQSPAPPCTPSSRKPWRASRPSTPWAPCASSR